MLELYFFNNKIQEVDLGDKSFIERLDLVFITDLGNIEFYTNKEKTLLYTVYSPLVEDDYTITVWELGYFYRLGDCKGVLEEEVLDIYNKEEFQGWLLIRKYI